MAVNDTLCFANFDTVTSPTGPRIDGHVQPDLGVDTPESIESGYVKGSRLTMGGAGFPPVVFQGVKKGNNLVLGFFCRGDFSFDGEPTFGDVLVLALRPSQASPDQSTARRLDIFPVWKDIGAEEKSANDPSSPGNTPDDFPGFAVRTNRPARRIDFYRGQSGLIPWVAASAASITGLDVKVRSWLPPIAAQTNTVGTQSTSSATLNVISTAPFPAQGLLKVNGTRIDYTGKSTTSFTGCTSPDASVTVPAGTPVVIPECAWSVEVSIPISGGGTDWITLADGFGLYFNVIRLGRTSASGGTPSQTWHSTQFRFPAEVPGNALSGALDATTVIDPTWYGTGLIPALQVPPGSNRGLGVFFTNDALGIGRRTLGSTTTTLDHLIQGPSGTVDNEIVGLLSNSGPADALNVTATFRVANWGLGPAGFTFWDLPVGMSNNPTAPLTVSAGASDRAVVAPWPKASVPASYGSAKHQCIWCQLDANTNVNFVQSSTRRNMDFVGFSEVDRDAEISGVGYPAPASGSHHDFLLFTRARRILLRKPELRLTHDLTHDGGILGGATSGMMEGADVVYLWITEGYRRTGKVLRIGDVDTEVLDESPGAFGYIGQHRGADDGVEWEFVGSGLSGAGNVHQLRVPHEGSVRIRTRVRTFKPGEQTKPPKPTKPSWWWVLLLLILIVLWWLLK